MASEGARGNVGAPPVSEQNSRNGGPKALARGAQRRAFLRDPTPQHGFHVTPTPGAWLNQVEVWLSVLARRFLHRGGCCAPDDCATRLVDDLAVYHTHDAPP